MSSFYFCMIVYFRIPVARSAFSVTAVDSFGRSPLIARAKVAPTAVMTALSPFENEYRHRHRHRRCEQKGPRPTTSYALIKLKTTTWWHVVWLRCCQLPSKAIVNKRHYGPRQTRFRSRELPVYASHTDVPAAINYGICLCPYQQTQ